MGSKTPPWCKREDDTATCSRCGGISQYVFFIDDVTKKRYRYWYWWKQFKKHHRKCIER